MLNVNAHSLMRCKKNIHVLEKAGMITRQNAWFANQEPIYLLCTKNLQMCLKCTHLQVFPIADVCTLNTHLQLKKHRKAVRGATASTKMTNYLGSAGSKCEDEINAAEGTLEFHAVKHHHSFLSTDHTLVLL